MDRRTNGAWVRDAIKKHNAREKITRYDVMVIVDSVYIKEQIV